ncbi:MAG TPA: UvrD-helicase domain-containing protein [Gemmataceae bacterium]|nr:UvrD-helicase domain-containing protein [Gemmataceae bacterium]
MQREMEIFPMAQAGQPVDLLSDLTPAQQEAVTHFEGPLLILAGAGSGKTRVITRRVAWLLTQGVRPWNILAITFTNKAAGEMRERVQKLVPDSKVWISTFHALGASLLRRYADRLNLDRNFTIYDTDDRKKIIQAAIEAAGIDDPKFTPDQIGGAISKAKNQLLLPEHYAARARDFFTETVAHVYPYYNKLLRAVNAMDFDDLLLLPALALRQDAELRAELDARFRYLLIDEYQDTNIAQYELAKQITIDQPNICVVGDPDQSIYKWRGSDIRNILDFERDFPNAHVITLEKNYRSTKAILQAASALIDHNKQRKKKTLVTDNPEGQPVQILTWNDGLEEANRVAERIKEAAGAGKRRYREFAIFLRTNALSRSLESAFIKHGVPYQMVRGLAFYERKENRDILAYLRLLVNPRDDISFLRVINEPVRGIGKVSLEHLRQYAQAREICLLTAATQFQKIPAIKGKAASGLRDFCLLMASLHETLEQPPDEVVRQVIDRSGYSAMLRNSKDTEDHERLENIQELITAAAQFARDDPERRIGDFLESITLASDVDSWDERQDCVSVMTLHAAKGLEFPVVYILAVEHGVLPHARSLEYEEDVEEERRLCFVGMTRAKEELYLSNARNREFGGQFRMAQRSDFLNELSTAVEQHDYSSGVGSISRLNFWRGGGGEAARAGWDETGMPAPRKTVPDEQGYFEGAIVEHAEHGRGMIVELSGYGANRMVRVRFEKDGLRAFRASHSKLIVIAEEPF